MNLSAVGLSIPWRRNDSLRDVSYFSGKNIVFLVGRYQQQSTTGRVDLQLMSFIASTIPATFFLIYITQFKQMPGQRPFQAPSIRIRIFFNPKLFLSGFGFSPHVSGESSIRIPKFFNPLSRVEIFEYAMNPDSNGR